MDKDKREELRIAAIKQGMRQAYAATPEAAKKAAIAFLMDYAHNHRYFCAGDALEAWRKTPDRFAHINWRNKWGGLVNTMAKQGVIKRHGKVKPKSVQSHTASLVEWESMIYIGPDVRRSAASEQIKKIADQYQNKKIGLEKALWSAYEYGVEQ